LISVFLTRLDLDNRKNEQEEVEQESEESECPDYFFNINKGRKQSVAQVPPQNYIVPKNRKLFKGKGGSKSFMKTKPKQEDKDDYTIELI
jgi:hypothetical protein